MIFLRITLKMNWIMMTVKIKLTLQMQQMLKMIKVLLKKMFRWYLDGTLILFMNVDTNHMVPEWKQQSLHHEWITNVFSLFASQFFQWWNTSSTNLYADEANRGNFTPTTLDELLHLFGLIYSMDVQKLPECQMYWHSADCGIFKAMDYSRIMARTRFETILANLQLSKSQDRNQLVLDFIDALNSCFWYAV